MTMSLIQGKRCSLPIRFVPPCGFISTGACLLSVGAIIGSNGCHIDATSCHVPRPNRCHPDQSRMRINSVASYLLACPPGYVALLKEAQCRSALLLGLGWGTITNPRSKTERPQPTNARGRKRSFFRSIFFTSPESIHLWEVSCSRAPSLTTEQVVQVVRGCKVSWQWNMFRQPNWSGRSFSSPSTYSSLT